MTIGSNKFEKASQLKSIKTRLQKEEAAKKTLSQEINALNNKLNDSKKRIQKLKREEKNITLYSKDIMITEHAILRYLERVEGLDLQEIIHTIIPDETRKLIKEFGNGSYNVKGKYKLIIKDNALVSIVENKNRGERNENV